MFVLREREDGRNRDRWRVLGCEAGLGRNWERKLDLSQDLGGDGALVATAEMNGGLVCLEERPFAAMERQQVALIVRMTASRPMLCSVVLSGVRQAYGYTMLGVGATSVWSVFQIQKALVGLTCSVHLSMASHFPIPKLRIGDACPLFNNESCSLLKLLIGSMPLTLVTDAGWQYAALYC